MPSRPTRMHSLPLRPAPHQMKVKIVLRRKAKPRATLRRIRLCTFPYPTLDLRMQHRLQLIRPWRSSPFHPTCLPSQRLSSRKTCAARILFDSFKFQTSIHSSIFQHSSFVASFHTVGLGIAKAAEFANAVVRRGASETFSRESVLGTQQRSSWPSRPFVYSRICPASGTSFERQQHSDTVRLTGRLVIVIVIIVIVIDEKTHRLSEKPDSCHHTWVAKPCSSGGPSFRHTQGFKQPYVKPRPRSKCQRRRARQGADSIQCQHARRSHAQKGSGPKWQSVPYFCHAPPSINRMLVLDTGSSGAHDEHGSSNSSIRQLHACGSCPQQVCSCHNS
jgi:hypothetical protein